MGNFVLEKLEKITLAGIEALQAKDLFSLGRLMTEYYLNLSQLGISTKELDQIVNLALENKALGAKPTGGWGVVVWFWSREKKSLKN